MHIREKLFLQERYYGHINAINVDSVAKEHWKHPLISLTFKQTDEFI